MEDFTPMIRQYLSVKKKYKETVLFFRLGDFYETFFEDARLTSRILDIVLTSREGGKGRKVPMAGIPYHAAEGYISRLVKAGYKIAICEQVENPKEARGLVKREVVRVITPGTVLSEALLSAKDNNYLISLVQGSRRFGFAYLDHSTGEFKVTEMDKEEELLGEVERLTPREGLIPEHLVEEEELTKILGERIPTLTPYPEWHFTSETATEVLKEHFGVHSLDGFGLRNFPLGKVAAGAIIQYLRELQGPDLAHISELGTYSLKEFMVLDEATRRNLELVRGPSSDKGTSLISILDNTLTPMGGRTLNQWVTQPLLKREVIQERLDAVEELCQDHSLRRDLQGSLRDISDLERIMGRVDCGYANARDLVALRKSLERIPPLKRKLSLLKSPLLKRLWEEMVELRETVDLLNRALVDTPPLTLREGGIIRRGFDEELDQLRDMSEGGKNWIANLQKEEMEKTGIKSLKVGYNKVFGYYIEVTKPNLHLVPAHYLRKQTLVNSERFITPELKEKESLVLGAEERIKEREFELFNQVRKEVSLNTSPIQKVARAVGVLDSLLSLAEVAVDNNYVKPEIGEGDRIHIVEGRHPVLEKTLSGAFVPNDVLLDSRENQILIITGPNMAGKSTFIRQVALVVLMAQIGSFVPAKKAEIGLVDRIFTRVGASDQLARGQSTFMVEMNEVANILHHATPRSLIVLDEVGRGTSTFDGVSIAWAVAEYLHDNPGVSAKTLFATHYHELTELEATLERVKNYNIAVREWEDEIIFLYQVVRGGTDKSYGIHVARLAGIPRKVIDRAKEILVNLERGTVDDNGMPRFAPRRKKRRESESQLTFFTPRPHPLVEEVKKLNPDELTPKEALQKLYELKEKLKNQ